MKINECPACGGVDVRHMHSHHYSLSMEPSEPSKKIKCRYYLCVHCSHIFYAASQLTEEDLYKHYLNKPSAALDKHSLDDKYAVKRIADTLSFILSGMDGRSFGKVLEIGGADGHLLRTISSQKIFEQSEFFLHDYSEDSCRIAREAGVNVINDIEHNAPYDLIIFRHTLEHTLVPFRFLRDVYDKLIPKGIIYAEVPSWVTPFGRTDSYNPEHIQQFNQRSIHWLMARSGFNILHDFTTFFDNYGTTDNRLIGVVSEKSKTPELSSYSDGFQGFEARYRLERQLKSDLLGKVEDILASLVGEDRVIVFHGASISLNDFLQNEGQVLNLARIVITDGNSNKHGSKFMGKTVLTPTHDLASVTDYVFCFSSYHQQIRSDWSALGFNGQFVVCF